MIMIELLQTSWRVHRRLKHFSSGRYLIKLLQKLGGLVLFTIYMYNHNKTINAASTIATDEEDNCRHIKT